MDRASRKVNKVPSSRKALQDQAIVGLQASWNPQARLQLWFRAFERIRREAETVQAEGDLQQAYMLLLRCVELVVTYMPTHPEAKSPDNRRQLAGLNRVVASMMEALATLRTKVDEQYAVYLIDLKREAALTQQRPAADAAQRQIQQVQADKNVHQSSEAKRASLMHRLDALRVTHQLDESNAKLFEPVKTSQKTPAAVAQPSPVTEFKPSPQQKKAEIMPSYNFSTTAKLENGTELRTIFVPATLRSAFLQLAASNTQRNLETCGILSGRLKANAYFVTHLIIPAQESTSDTCHTTDETLLFNYQDKHDLFTLGWIHTHPTQTCFMSSVDVHTHMSYQVMLPEAVAIVLSPSKQPSWGAFRLTDPPGMQCIRACRQTGLFHPHDETHIYTDALHESGSSTGHVRELASMAFTTIDQRLNDSNKS